MKQSYSSIEIICVDNNSTDNTFQLIKNIELQYPGKIQVVQELKKGAPAARNKGLSVATGHWIQFLDADDLLMPEKISHQIALVHMQQNIAFVGSSYYNLSVEGHKKTRALNLRDPFKAIFTTNLGITSANLFNAEKVKRINGWKEELMSSQEADLMFRLLKMGDDLIFDDVPFTIIRERASGQISQRNPKEKWLHYIGLRLEMINFLKRNRTEYFEKEKSFYYNNLFSQLRTLAKYSPEDAAVILKSNFEQTFIKGDEFPFSIYKVMYKLFGFKKTEQLKRIIYDD